MRVQRSLAAMTAIYIHVRQAPRILCIFQYFTFVNLIFAYLEEILVATSN